VNTGSDDRQSRTLPAFLITIDTEGDDLWAKPARASTVNAAYLPRFQALCERFGMRPTYLTNHEMARSDEFRTFANDVLARHVGEIGMHLHAWDTPPIVPLTQDDARHQPFLVEYPDEVMRQKIDVMTDLLRDVFEVAIVSHRAGRWAFNAPYAQMLIDRGYLVDCSVCPNHSWRAVKGDPRGEGGTDYRGFPELPYFVDPTDLSKAGASPLLEVPMTVVKTSNDVVGRVLERLHPSNPLYRSLRKLAPALWLRPNGRNLPQMIRILRRAESESRPHVEFMLHSSELMPGGSPNFPTQEHVERLYSDMERLFADATGRFEGLTLAEFRAHFDSTQRHAG
jgi:hypothetical protein